MNITQLRAFVAVVEHGSFSEAARAVGLSQPAVTMQIQALESDVGATLLDRRYRKVDLTEAGRTLLPYARKVLSELEQAREEIESLSDRITGRLVLAASTTPGQYVLPRLLGSFLKANPEVGVAINVHDTAEVVDAVESGQAQLGVVGAKVRGARVEFERAGIDDLVMIAPPDSPLLARTKLVMTDVAAEPFIMREAGSGTRQVTEDVLRGSGIEPEELLVVTELGTSEAIVSAIEGGLGIAVVSRYVADKALKLGTVGQVPVGEFPVSRPLYVVKPRGSMTRAAEAFFRHYLATVGE